MDNFKYVVLTFLNNDTYLVGEHKYKDNKSISGYIVSGAFVVNKKVDEDNNIKYEVYLPYSSPYDEEPSCTYEVDKVFDSIFDSREYLETINDELRRDIILEAYKSKKDKFSIEEEISRLDSNNLLHEEIQSALILKSKKYI